MLVVIAIIGLLSAIVLASLGAARDKASDAAIQSDLRAIQLAAELYYSNQSPSTYSQFATGPACPTSGTTMWFTDPTIKNAIAAADRANGTAASNGVYCSSSTGTYVVWAKLVANPGYWCVDSAGNARTFATQQGAGITSCP